MKCRHWPGECVFCVGDGEHKECKCCADGQAAILNTINSIKEENNFFDMGRLFREDSDIFAGDNLCKTPACVAGHALSANNIKQALNFTEAARGVLHLTLSEADELFTPKKHYADYRAIPHTGGHITREHALTVLEYFALTGNIDWKIGIADPDQLP